MSKIESKIKWQDYVSEDIRNIIDHTCRDKNGNLLDVKTCKITDEKINNITYFLVHKLPKCEELKININSVRRGKIIGRGAYGYSFLVETTTKKKNNN